MNIINFAIADKNTFQQQVLEYFASVENMVFINKNNNEANLIGISRTSQIKKNSWQFGFVSYDYKNQIEPQLHSNNSDFIQFATKHFFTPELLFEILDNEVSIYFEPENYNEDEVNEIVQQISKVELSSRPYVSVNITPRLTKNEYLEKVKALKKHIQLGDIYEVNFCQEFYAENIEVDPIQLYFKLNEKSPTPFSCFVKQDDKYLISASPERFIQKKEKQLISQPIKGTIKRGANNVEDEQLKQQLQKDVKERSENIMIVDLVRNDLAKIAANNSVKVDELCGIYTFPQVHQMISTISAELKEQKDFEAIIKAMFPMGSMTGAPKIRAMELIEEYETSKRGLYSGTVGFIDPFGNFDFNVVIRSILYNSTNHYLSFFVGGAITNLSDPEKEYEECLLKAKAMLEVLC